MLNPTPTKVRRAYRRTGLIPLFNQWAMLKYDGGEYTRTIGGDNVRLCGCGLTAIACDITPGLATTIEEHLRDVNDLPGGVSHRDDERVAPFIVDALDKAGYLGAVMAGFIHGFDTDLDKPLPQAEANPRSYRIGYHDDPAAPYYWDAESVLEEDEDEEGRKYPGRYLTLAEIKRHIKLYNLGAEMGRDARIEAEAEKQRIEEMAR